MSDDPDDRDLLAGEYVLGVLEPAEARAVEARAEQDEMLAQSIEKWRNQLAPLAGVADPVPPPAFVWPRVETTLGFAPASVAAVQPLPAAPAAKPARLLGRPGFWRFTTLGSLAVAAGFAAFAFLGRPPPADYTAALAPYNAPGPAFLARWQPDGSLVVRPLTNVTVQTGKDLELWILPAGAKVPQSLGVLPPIGRQLVTQSAQVPGAQLLVSLEPAGGSPSGLPTGPVLYAGTVTRVD